MKLRDNAHQQAEREGEALDTPATLNHKRLTR